VSGESIRRSISVSLWSILILFSPSKLRTSKPSLSFILMHFVSPMRATYPAHFTVLHLSLLTYFFKKALTILRGHLAYPNGLLDLHIETFGRTPLPGDQPDVRPLPTQDNTTQKHADTHPCPKQYSNLRSQCPSGRKPLGYWDMHLLTYLLTYLFHSWCRIFFEKLIITQLVKHYPAFFMEPEGTLPCSQKPAIGPYSESAESSSPHRSLSP
jgi:hypothetical protein